MAKITRLRHAPLRLVSGPAAFPQVTGLRLRGVPSPALVTAAQNLKKAPRGGRIRRNLVFFAKIVQPSGARARGHPQVGGVPDQ